MQFELNEYHRNISNEELINDVKRIANYAGKTTLTATEYSKLGKFHSDTLRLLTSLGEIQYHKMRQFYLTYPNSHALRDELSWTHYRLLMRVENENARKFYMEEAVKGTVEFGSSVATLIQFIGPMLS
jgi:hypothetical protein